MISVILACNIREASQYLCLTETAAPLSRSLINADVQRERERGVCMLGKKDLARQYTSEYQKLKVWASPKDLLLGTFLEGKKSR